MEEDKRILVVGTEGKDYETQRRLKELMDKKEERGNTPAKVTTKHLFGLKSGVKAKGLEAEGAKAKFKSRLSALLRYPKEVSKGIIEYASGGKYFTNRGASLINVRGKNRINGALNAYLKGTRPKLPNRKERRAGLQKTI